jgi:hypothetical protein
MQQLKSDVNAVRCDEGCAFVRHGSSAVFVTELSEYTHKPTQWIVSRDLDMTQWRA